MPLSTRFRLSRDLSLVVPSSSDAHRTCNGQTHPGDGLRSMSVIGACAYFRVAELTTCGFHIFILITYGLVLSPENDLIWRGAEGVAAR